MKKLIEAFSQYRGLSKSAYVIFFGRLITNMGAFIWPLLTLIMSEKMGYSESTIAQIFLGVGLLFLPANMLGGKLADRFDRRKIIVIFDLLSVFFFMMCAFVEPSNLMMGLFIIAGLFANMEGPAYEALVADATKPAERDKTYSLMYLGMNLGYMFGAAIGGLLFKNYLNIAFIFDGLTTLSSTILIVLLVKPINLEDLKEDEKNVYEDHVEHETMALSIIKERPSVFYQILIFMFGAFVYDQFGFAIPLYMAKLFGENGPAMYGFLTSFNALIVISMTPILTMLLSKLNEIPKIIIGQIMIAVSYVLLFNQPTYGIFFVMMTFFTLGEIINMLGSSPFMSKRVPASHRGRVNSYRNIAFFLGGSVGRVVIGELIVRFGYQVAFSLLIGIGLLNVALATFNYRVDKKIFPKLYKQDAV